MKKGRLRTDDQFDYESKQVIRQHLAARARAMTAAHVARRNQLNNRSRQWFAYVLQFTHTNTDSG